MKFCDKLVKLRKSNNMSQEQLADRLSVSRQAVSKWESGSSVPDMEKIMQLCKVLNCSLDDLVDDGACGNKSTGNKENNTSGKNNYLKEVLDFITKTINMFWSMRLVEKVKCILEMAFIVVVMVIIWMLVGQVVYSIFSGARYIIPYFLYAVIYQLCSIVYKIFGCGAGIVIFIHLFKIRYLDYFVTIEDGNTNGKSIEKPIDEVEKVDNDDNKRQFIEHRKNKIIIRDPKHSTYGFFNVLASIVIWLIKAGLIFVSFFGIMSFIGIVFGITYMITLVSSGLFFVGVILVLIGALCVNYIVLRLIYNFIFNQKSNYRVIFYIFIIGFILAGVGLGMSFSCYLTFDEVDYNKEIEYDTYERVIRYEDNMILDFLDCSYTEVLYENRNDIKIEVVYNDEGNVNISSYYSYNYDSEIDGYTDYIVYRTDYYEYGDSFVESLGYIVDVLKKKERIVTGVYEGIKEVKIYVSEDTYNKLKNNYEELYR